MKEITHIVFSNSGGAGNAAINLSNFLCQYGYQSRIFYVSKHGKFRFLRHPFVYLSSFLDNYVLKKIGYSSFFSILRGRIGTTIPNNSDTKIFHLHWTPGIVDLKKIWHMVNINNSKVIVTLHDTWFFTGGCHYTSTCELFFSSCNKCPKIRSPFHFLVKQNYVLKEKIASHPNVKFIAPSKWIFDLAKKSKVLRNKELILAPNISMHYIRAREIISTKTKPKSSIKKNLTIGFLANNINDPRKNLSFLFQAIRILPKNYSSLVSLSIAGKGRIRNNNFTEKFNINKFNYLYSTSEIDNFFDSIDILAVPSLEDNAPMVASEAAIRGIPVLARRGTGLDELIKDRVSGFLFSDTDDFLSIIVDLIYDKTVLAVMGNVFKLDFLNINDPKIILKIYDEVY